MITHFDSYAPPSFKPNTWFASHTPAVSVVASVTQPSPGPGKRLVVTGFTVTIGGGTTAPAATTVIASLRSGSVELWTAKLGAPATAASISGVARSGYWPGGVDLPVKLLFSGTATNVEQSVSMEGYEEDVT